MNTVDSRASTPPPGLVSSLVAGFDSITNHVELILIPVALDLFFWLGPHLRMKTLVAGFLNTLFSGPGANAPETAELVRLSRELWSAAAERINLFTVLRTYPVGVSSLMASELPIKMPFGDAILWEASSAWMVIGVWLALSLVGLGLGAFYFLIVSQAALDGQVDWGRTFSRWPKTWFQIFLLSLFWAALLLALSIPASCMFTFITLSGLGSSPLGMFIYGFFVIWLFFPLLFSPHGIFVHQHNLWTSVREGVRIARMTFNRMTLLVLAIVLLSEGLDLVWRVPTETSWLMLVGIFGHAFVTTGLLAASFIYYRDAGRYIQRQLQQIKFSSM